MTNTANKRILIIDDDRHIWKAFRSLLTEDHQYQESLVRQLANLTINYDKSDPITQEHNFDLSYARQGQDGFVMVQESLAKHEPYSLAFIDMRMPPGLDGMETTAKIREIDPHIEIVIITAYSDRARDEIVKAVGTPEKILFLRKPFDSEELIQIAVSLSARWNQAQKERKQRIVEIKAMSQDKLASLGLLATGVSHEINQPLSYIKIMLQSCLRDMEEGRLDLSVLQEDSQESLRQLNRITTIIDHLRMFGRDGSLEKESVNLEEVLSNSLILVRQMLTLRNIEFSCISAEKELIVYGNAVQLEQVFINILQNSMDALAEVKEKKINVSFLSENNRVVIKFSDSGNGISLADRDKIFEPFFTTKEVGKGTGLGMSVVLGIVQEHDGSIEYFPAKQGCTFIISFPLLKVMTNSSN